MGTGDFVFPGCAPGTAQRHGAAAGVAAYSPGADRARLPLDILRLVRRGDRFSSEVREMALAHAVGDKVEAAYRRGDLFDKRRQLAEAWGRYCGQDAAVPAEILPLHRRRAS